jgi:hypothetical protein
MTINIFDTVKTEDLPSELLEQLKNNALNSYDTKIMSFFIYKKELNIDEILIALFRKYKIIKTRAWLSNRLYFLSQKNKVKKIAKGKYVCVKEEE